MPASGLGALLAVEAAGPGRCGGAMAKAAAVAMATMVGVGRGDEGGAAGELGFWRSSTAVAVATELRRNPSSLRQGGGRRRERGRWSRWRKKPLFF